MLSEESRLDLYKRRERGDEEKSESKGMKMEKHMKQSSKTRKKKSNFTSEAKCIKVIILRVRKHTLKTHIVARSTVWCCFV